MPQSDSVTYGDECRRALENLTVFFSVVVHPHHRTFRATSRTARQARFVHRAGRRSPIMLSRFPALQVPALFSPPDADI